MLKFAVILDCSWQQYKNDDRSDVPLCIYTQFAKYLLNPSLNMPNKFICKERMSANAIFSFLKREFINISMSDGLSLPMISSIGKETKRNIYGFDVDNNVLINNIHNSTNGNYSPIVFYRKDDIIYLIDSKTAKKCIVEKCKVVSDQRTDIVTKSILNKINKYKEQDKRRRRLISSDYISVDDVKKLLQKQKNKCYICSDTVITHNWEPSCLYQFTLDRIDDKIPHIRSNVLISCYYCNCYSYPEDLRFSDACKYKVCLNKCHTDKKEIKRNKLDVTYEEQANMRLD